MGLLLLNRLRAESQEATVFDPIFIPKQLGETPLEKPIEMVRTPEIVSPKEDDRGGGDQWSNYQEWLKRFREQFDKDKEKQDRENDKREEQGMDRKEYDLPEFRTPKYEPAEPESPEEVADRVRRNNEEAEREHKKTDRRNENRKERGHETKDYETHFLCVVCGVVEVATAGAICESCQWAASAEMTLAEWRKWNAAYQEYLKALAAYDAYLLALAAHNKRLDAAEPVIGDYPIVCGGYDSEAFYAAHLAWYDSKINGAPEKVEKPEPVPRPPPLNEFQTQDLTVWQNFKNRWRP